jgi:rhodanese-related sulfurtransferase
MASSTPDNFPKAIIGAFALVGLAVTIGSAHSLLKPVQLRANFAAPAQPAPTNDATNPEDAARTSDAQTEDTQIQPAPSGHLLNLGQAYALFNEGEAIFLDARRSDDYEQSHILGSMHLSTESIASGAAGPVLDELLGFGLDYPLILYCHGGDCDASENTAIRLQQMGFTNIRIMTAGFDEWVNAGYEVETP